MTDPIQHLRELAAKADEADSAHRKLMATHSARTVDQIDAAFIAAVRTGNARDEALRNLAPQLLEVVDRVKTYERFHGDPVAGYVAQCALFDALAALGGKGGGG